MTRTFAVLALTAAAFLPATASATSTNEAVNLCKVELRQQLGADATIDFKSIKGSSRLKTLKFFLKADSATDRVKCMVRRDGSVDIKWGKDVRPSVDRAVEVEAMSATGG